MSRTTDRIDPASVVGQRGPGVVVGPVAPADGVWLQDNSTSLMVINSVFTTDQMDIDTFRQLWSDRVLSADGGQRYPRFRWRVSSIGGRPHWQEDPDFDICNHIVEVPETGEAAPDTKEKLEAYVGQLASRPLPNHRSPWQLLLVPSFGDNGSAVICRVHHVLGDGIAMVQVLFSIMDGSAEGGAMVLPSVIDRGGQPPNRALLALSASLAGPLVLLRKMMWRSDPAPLHGIALRGEKKVAWTGPIDIEMVKGVKNRFGATLNDVLVACVAGAFRRYLEDHADEVPRQLQVSMPVNVRSRFEDIKMDNKFAAVLLSLPIDESNARLRTLETKRRLDALKRSVEPVTTYGLVHVMLKTLPQSLSRGLIDYFANKCTCVLSNVPGPQKPVYLAGRRLRAMLFWVPQRAQVGIGVSIISYDGFLRVGVIADSDLISEPGKLTAAFETEFAELQNAV